MTDSTLLVLGGEPAPRLDRLSGRARVVHARDAESLAALLPSADALLVWDFTTDVLRSAWPGEGRRPRWVHTASAGVDRLLFPELTDSDAVVTNARGIFEQPIAEYVAGLVIALAKDFPGSWELQQRRQWRHRETMRLAGSRAVVAGSGPIGRAIGRTLAALGVVVELVGRTARENDAEFHRVYDNAALKDLLPSADWVIAAAPLTDDTHGMFGAEAFSLMRPTARFINVGRGQLVVERDLTEALVKGSLAGAALDVFEEEPLPPDSPLWDAPGLLVSPHMSGDTVGWRDALAEQFMDNFDRWVAGKPLVNVVDKRLGYVPVP
ncbi:D-2-hydroxyacid dehydrogenase [Streptomyces sp. WAC 00631]|uniref:D-2-hydroxyacid dehydrogenase n=1 Tax=unclassified Streptomyces TaxID=2593676 RepID=UPI000F79AAB9|nr:MULTISPECIES: D-2-hydroxyacid dehydrogenase [unclassified Streptomyces]MCC5033305.1 D-2-hydroxyacid dehydrogenase [Streptomyces sp. WAC 00631]MCC9741395.1 D-2-hydroxyacid dehydrogenase [Streptomyces sp. MNU89]